LICVVEIKLHHQRASREKIAIAGGPTNLLR
jgi:hypothetical protein